MAMRRPQSPHIASISWFWNFHPQTVPVVVPSIFEVLGSGKHSTVYKGRKKNTIIYYAIKSVGKEERARVLQEVMCFVLHPWHHG